MSSAVGPLVKRAGMLVDRVVPPPAGITVLIYHRVGGGSPSAVDLEPDVFERQLAHLAEHHRVLPLEDALAELAVASSGFGPEGEREPSSPGVVITFDDGTTDFTEVAVPALVRHGLPATLYAATQFIDEGTEFPWGAPPATWTALREATSTGLISIGSHTHSHWLLDRLDPAEIESDLDRSIDLIGSNIGTVPLDFAYPKAMPGSPAAEIAVRRRFRSASLAANRVNRPGRTDAHRLWRTPVQQSDDDRCFAAKASGGLRLEGELRALLASVRYRGAAR